MSATVFTVTAAWAAAGFIGWKLSRVHDHLIEHLDRQVKHVERFVMSAAQDAIDSVVGQLRKAQLEIVTKIAEVQDQVDAAGAAGQVDLSALTEAAQALDDVVPDAPAVDPAAPQG